MEIHLSIGQNHRLELHDALLVYRDRQTSFITRHDVQAQKSEPPTLGPAQPLTLAFVESLMRSLGGAVHAEVLPENILAKGDRLIVWWTPEQRRQMFYQNAEGKMADLNGGIFLQTAPGLEGLERRVERTGARLEQTAASHGDSCRSAFLESLGRWPRLHWYDAPARESATVAATPAWERSFYESAFTHANVGRITRHDGGFEGLWASLKGKRVRFPAEALIQLPQTLEQFVRGERGNHAH